MITLQRNNMSRLTGFILLLITGMTLSACSLAGDITPPPGSELSVVQQATEPVTSTSLYPILPPDLANGAQLYQQNCTQCHGPHGMGDGPQASQLSVPAAELGLSDFARQFTPADWYSVVTQGNMEKYMPSFANLTDRQRWDVIAYAMSMSTPSDMVSQGQTLYQDNCVNCHGQSGRGNGSDSASLSTKPADFTNQALMAQISSDTLLQAITSGVTPDMPAYSDSLDENARLALVAYLRSLTYVNAASVKVAYPPPAGSIALASSSTPYPGPQSYPGPAITPTTEPVITTEVTSTIPLTGSVAVQLINGTGGVIPNDATVTLYGFDDMQQAYSETLSVGVNGVYTFTNVSMPDGRAFLAGVDYDQGIYGSDIAMVDPAKPNLNLQITIFDPTTDVSVLSTDRVHILFDFTSPPDVSVVEVFIISNPSKQAVVPVMKGGTVLTFPLPQGYADLQFQDGELGGRFVNVSQGFADTQTVPPGAGEYQVIFAFKMPYNKKLDFSQAMFLPTSAVVVMVPDNGVKVNSSMLQDSGTRDFQNTTYRMYNGSDLIAGDSLEFTITGTPKTAGTGFFSAGSMQSLAIGLGGFGLALVVGGVWLYRKNQKKAALQASPSATDIASPLTELPATPEYEDTLMDAIIALDDQFHAGKLPKDAYLERRAILKEKLRKLEQG